MDNIVSSGEPLKKKRGRRKKSEMEQQPLPNISINIEENLTQNNLLKSVLTLVLT